MIRELLKDGMALAIILATGFVWFYVAYGLGY
jgi:hypothetical protein